MAEQVPAVAVGPENAPGIAPDAPAKPPRADAASVAEKLATERGGKPRRPPGRPRNDGLPAGSEEARRVDKAKPRRHRRTVPAPEPPRPVESSPAEVPSAPRVDPAVLRPVVAAGYRFADRIVCGRIEAAMRRLGADAGLAEAWANEAAVEPKTLDAISDYGGQCLAQIFDALGLRGEHACWLGFVMFVGGDVKRKDNVLKKVAELAKAKSTAAEQHAASAQAN